jgi:hypothetical protein
MSEDGIDTRSAQLAQLEEFPALLATAFGALDPALVRRRGPGDSFAPVEQAWHLVDLEQEGFGERIRLMLFERRPPLPDFDGARIAVERDYRNRSLDEGVLRFVTARAENLAQLRALNPAQWQRDGVQEGAGPLTLNDMPARMLAHDAAHINEIRAWFRHHRLPDPWSA